LIKPVFFSSSLIAVGGLLEMAQPLGLERQPYNCGQTLYFMAIKIPLMMSCPFLDL
jgi:hypothetical protein